VKRRRELGAGNDSDEGEVTDVLASTGRVNQARKRTPKPIPTTPAVRTVVAVPSMVALRLWWPAIAAFELGTSSTRARRSSLGKEGGIGKVLARPTVSVS
jgi:hypothetical protein